MDRPPGNPAGARSRSRVDRARGGQPAARSPAAAGGPLRPGGADLRAGRRPPPLDRADAAASAGPGAARLRERLIRRGVTAGAVGAVLAASTAGARAAVPAALAARRSPRRRAARPRSTAAALSADIIRSLLMTRLKIAAAGLLAARSLSAIAPARGRRPSARSARHRDDLAGRRRDEAAPGRRRTQHPRPRHPPTDRGPRPGRRSAGPAGGRRRRAGRRPRSGDRAGPRDDQRAGRPVHPADPPLAAQPGARRGAPGPLGGRVGAGVRARLGLGRACARRPGRGDDPAGGGRPADRGRIVDLEGRPVVGARIKVATIWFAREGGLSAWLDRVRNDGVDGNPGRAWYPLPGAIEAGTDPDGRFRLAGIGRDRLAELFVSGPTIATAQLYAANRDGPAVRVTGTTGVTAKHPGRPTMPAASSTPPSRPGRSRA